MSLYAFTQRKTTVTQFWVTVLGNLYRFGKHWCRLFERTLNSLPQTSIHPVHLYWTDVIGPKNEKSVMSRTATPNHTTDKTMASACFGELELQH